MAKIVMKCCSSGGVNRATANRRMAGMMGGFIWYFQLGMILLVSGIVGIAAVVLLTAVVNGWLNRKETEIT